MIDYFIVCHDTTIINDTHNFDNLPDHRFLVVGNKYSNLINKQHIICDQLPINIEHLPYLCSYTAWYALVSNRLNNHKNICLLEYDTLLNNSFHIINQQIINKQNNSQYIIGYNKTLTNHYVFLKSTPWLEISLKKVYNIDLIEFTKENYISYPYWPTTTNITTTLDVLEAFKEWFDPMTKLFAHHKLGSYVQERAFFIFCVMHNIDINHAPKGSLIHYQLQSHKCSDVYGEFLSNQKTNILDESAKTEYDSLYNSHKNSITTTS